jgi:sporulation protein YlmC with PRC-barrel domain
LNVLDIIKSDHDLVIKTLEELEKTGNADIQARDDGIWRLRKLSMPHMNAEEMVFYPALDNEIHDLVNKSIEDHRMARDSINDLDNIPRDDDRWMAKLLTTRDLIVNHLNLEEGPVFNTAIKVFSEDKLRDMGKRFEEAKGYVVPETVASAAAASSRGSSRGAGAEAYAPSAAGAPVSGMAPLIRSSTLKGEKVKNAQGDDLGKVEEVMIEMETGRIGYVVLSFGGFMGLGDKLFAVPWNALALEPARKELILNVSKDKLANAPGFDKNNWPDMASPEWGEGIRAFYK